MKHCMHHVAPVNCCADNAVTHLCNDTLSAEVATIGNPIGKENFWS